MTLESAKICIGRSNLYKIGDQIPITKLLISASLFENLDFLFLKIVEDKVLL